MQLPLPHFFRWALILWLGFGTDIASATSGEPAIHGVKPPAADPNEFHFVVLGDAQFDNPATFNRVIDQVRRLRPALVLQVGDLIEGYNSDLQVIRGEWQRFKRQIAPLAPIPFYGVPGNHDVYGSDKEPDAALEAAFEEEMGPLFYHFQYKNTLFVVLNSDTREAMGSINETQMNWLRRVLAASSADHKFAFMHRPPFLMDNAETLHNLFKAFGVGQVFYGHHHHYHHHQRDGVSYTMTNAGGLMGQAEPLVGGYHHLLQVSVRSDSVDVAVIAADSIAPQDSVRAEDNYDMFSLTQSLVSERTPMQRTGTGQYSMVVQLANNSRRDIQVFIECDSPDKRWHLEPASIDLVVLQAGTKREIPLTASYADDRQPEGTPHCDVRAPMQTHFGKWTHFQGRTVGVIPGE